ncbi:MULTISPECIES: relaxase/mobilization nuclease domain-containing protein [Myroides]|uniref:relaxase/mobilization nuclease domain-containing protein n=1 Tax=Myroides TaxID=76831 RepID=UPI0015F81D08|nr:MULTISPECIES: relaxase/mobilization nuclease domain-containing protein [Myroides]MBB1139025.1 relaxase/mobilization nuclease domain-containing protein [Myroides sp. WP-1]MDM1035951.1 relaxase/mobilization nuclease domain-containing protein [Myroides odoratimimus]MDM1060138.1 relaxase/mobilization nuclease domain-containing protein [Myroides odoratimimus]
MIAKAKTCIGAAALFNYVINPNKGYELVRNNLSGETPKDMFQTMQILQNQNSRCKNNTISVVISPTITDSKKMTDKDLNNLIHDFLVGLKLDPKSAQYIAYIHTEKEHKHIHILANRIDENGKALKDNYIGFQAQRIAHEIALKYGWASIRQENENKKEQMKANQKQVAQEIKEAHYFVLKEHPKSLQRYIDMMRMHQIEVNPSVNKQGNIQGYRFIHLPTGTNLKASEIDRNLKLNELFENSIPKRNDDLFHTVLYKDQGKEISFENWSTNTVSLFSFLNSHSNHYEDYAPDMTKKKKRKQTLNL